MTKQIDIYFQLLSQLVPPLPQQDVSRSVLKAYQQQHIEVYRAAQLARQLGVTPDALQFSTMEYGKPFLQNFPELAFNHSHGREHYALALSQTLADIGIDIESLQRKVRFDALAQHAFHPEEYQHWQATDYHPSYWFQVWTAKEAILKACGLGIRMSLNQLNTNTQFEQMQGRCQHPDLGCFRYQHQVLHGAMLTIAWRETAEYPQIMFHCG